MKLLFDENLSPRLAVALSSLFPQSSHVDDCDLLSATDETVWSYARANEFAIVTKDMDFSAMSRFYGSPPKVIWLRVGNCTTIRAEFILLNLASLIQDFLLRGKDSCLVLRHPHLEESNGL